MVFSIFGNKKQQPEQPQGDGPQTARFVRPMQPDDIDPVLQIIDEHDEDDAEEAEESFRESIDGMYVAVDNGRVVGVTGAFGDAESDDIAWLSWTYVATSERRQGMGRYLIEGLLHQLKVAGVRKIFISTGEYYEDGEDIYAAAKGFYENQGARLELKMDNYFEEGEPRCIYGLDLEDPADLETPPPLTGDLVFDGLYEAPETEEGLSLTWSEFNPEEAGEGAEHPKDALERLLGEAREKGATFVIAPIPSDLAEGAAKGLEAMGFKLVGELKDYYQPGVNQQHWHLLLDRYA